MLSDWLVPTTNAKYKKSKRSHSIKSGSIKYQQVNISLKKGKIDTNNKKQAKILNQQKSNKSKTIKIKSGTQKQIGQIQYIPQSNNFEIINQQDKRTIGNSDKNKIKAKIMQLELERQQIIRQGIISSTNQTNTQSINKQNKFNSSILNQSTKPLPLKQNNIMIQSSHVRGMEQKIYEQIANQIELNNLNSKIRIQDKPAQKFQSTFFQKLRSSESQLAGSSSPKNRLIDPEKKNNESDNHNNFPLKKSILQNIQMINMEKIDDNQSNSQIQEENFQQIPFGTKKNEDQQQILRKNSPQNSKNQSLNQKNIFVEKSSYKKGANDQERRSKMDFNISSGLINHKIKEKKIDTNQISQKQKDNYDINQLKQVVKDLRMQKIKVIAQIKNKQQMNSFQTTSNNDQFGSKRYQTFDLYNESNSSQQNKIIFGRIKKNRITLRQSVNYTTNSKLKPQRPYDDPSFRININHQKKNNQQYQSLTNRNYQTKSKQLSFSARENKKQYQTINFDRLRLENQQFDFTTLKQNKDISSKKQNFEQKTKSNKISMRGQQLCSKFLYQFEKNDKNFRKFMKNQTIKSYLRTSFSSEHQSIKGFATTSKLKNTNNSIKKQSNKTSGKKIDVTSSFLGHQIKLKNGEFILQKQRILIKQKGKSFQLKTIPQIPQKPNYNSSTQQLMKLVDKIMLLYNIQYKQQDLEGCILKKYKNCMTFQLESNKNFKIIWHFNGKLYVGEWNIINNTKQGLGVQYYANKFYYKGNFQNNKKQGQGIMIDSNNSVYQGSFANNSMNGFGKYFNKVDNTYYQGQWKKGAKFGQGHLQQQGNIYEGQFKNNLRDGIGIQVFKNGDRYIGEYKQDKFNGQGKYIWYNKQFYIGLFNNGYREGSGIWQSSLENYQLYIGQFQKDKKHGKGKYIWNNNTIYQGSFFNDSKHGLGNMQCPDGRIIQGIWTQDILTEVLSKVTQSNKQQPLQLPFKGKKMEEKTIIRIISMNQQ